MKKAINAWSIPGDVGFADMFAQVSSAGFDGIELNIDEAGQSAHSLHMGTTADELKAIRALSEQYNLPVASISTSQYNNRLGSACKTDNDGALALLFKQIECAEALGADGILAVPGGISDAVSMHAAYNNVCDALLSVKDQIEAHDVWVGLENVWNKFFLSPYDMVKMIDGLDIKNVCAYFDVGNVAFGSEPQHWIEILGHRIKKIHVKGFDRDGRINQGTFVNLLEGTINWRAVSKALRDAGYDGHITAELGTMDICPQYLYDITSKALDIIIA